MIADKLLLEKKMAASIAVSDAVYLRGLAYNGTITAKDYLARVEARTTIVQLKGPLK